MKYSKPLPIPQKEFGFTADTFNLFAEFTTDGERIAREREQAEQMRQRAEAAQLALTVTKKKVKRRLQPVG